MSGRRLSANPRAPLLVQSYGDKTPSLSGGTVYPRGLRFVSTTPPPPTNSVAKDVLPPVANATSRKPKVDLRPGPVKPPKASSELAPSPNASERAASPTSVSETSSTPSGEVETSHDAIPTHPDHSVLQTAKEDYYDASKHGILKPPPEDASWAGRLFHQAKELFRSDEHLLQKFYWNGIKLINVNRKHVRVIQARANGGGKPLTRWETRFIANYKRDALKLIPFVLIIIIAEEAIPLVVIYAPFLLPSTCLLPSQRERIENKRREKQTNFAVSMKSVFRDVYQRTTEQPELSVDKLLDRTAVVSYSGMFSLSTFGIPPVRMRRIKKHLAGVAADDALLIRENFGGRLTAHELREALEERGIMTGKLSPQAMRARLRWWLAEVNQTDGDAAQKRVQLVAANVIGKYDASA
ncbi:transporter [Ganoderma sinense ZZ0214-1]|uniref:Transporter n=1 Tax=Ganoderma sinense ZZ0214-1 TaxID=1077348 RepID=A0A2G8SK01_9APHY|nr:transporter [Ganoderma sinense ZZ0214-1]